MSNDGAIGEMGRWSVRGSRLSYSARANVGVGLILLFAGLSDLQLLRTAVTPAPADTATIAERRLAPLGAILPSHGTVGYVAPRRLGIAFDQAYHEKLSLTRYVLSPLLVVEGTETRRARRRSRGPAEDRSRHRRARVDKSGVETVSTRAAAACADRGGCDRTGARAFLHQLLRHSGGLRGLLTPLSSRSKSSLWLSSWWSLYVTVPWREPDRRVLRHPPYLAGC